MGTPPVDTAGVGGIGLFGDYVVFCVLTIFCFISVVSPLRYYRLYLAGWEATLQQLLLTISLARNLQLTSAFRGSSLFSSTDLPQEEKIILPRFLRQENHTFNTTWTLTSRRMPQPSTWDSTLSLISTRSPSYTLFSAAMPLDASSKGELTFLSSLIWLA